LSTQQAPPAWSRRNPESNASLLSLNSGELRNQQQQVRAQGLTLA